MQPHLKSLQVIYGFQQKESKVYTVMQKNQNSQNNTKVKGLTLLKLNTYYKGVVIKTV
jgi:hypothetical protein